VPIVHGDVRCLGDRFFKIGLPVSPMTNSDKVGYCLSTRLDTSINQSNNFFTNSLALLAMPILLQKSFNNGVKDSHGNNSFR